MYWYKKKSKESDVSGEDGMRPFVIARYTALGMRSAIDDFLSKTTYTHVEQRRRVRRIGRFEPVTDKEMLMADEVDEKRRQDEVKRREAKAKSGNKICPSGIFRA